MEGDDDDFSISSVEAQLMPPHTSSRAATATAGDTNTYSSKQWGHNSTANSSTLLSTSSKQGKYFPNRRF